MARYKLVDRSPRFPPIVLESQLMPGSFERALDILIDTEIDLSALERRFRNDETGAPAYDPAVMLTAAVSSPAARSNDSAVRMCCSWRSRATAPRNSPRSPSSSASWAMKPSRCSRRCCWPASGKA